MWTQFSFMFEVNTWSPLFSKIVDSSLWDEDDFVVKIFITMLAKKDSDHIVRGTAYNIAQWAKKPKEEARVLDALKRLQLPDTKRLEPQPFDGRRIEKIDGIGYLILNGQFYEDLMRAANRRAYKAAKQREYRSRGKSDGPMPGFASASKAEEAGHQAGYDQVLSDLDEQRETKKHESELKQLAKDDDTPF